MMAKPWNEHRHIITRLYIHDGRKLEDVRNIMKTEYNFEASIRSYRQHFDQWDVGKYNCKKRLSRRQAKAKRALLPSPPQTPVFESVSGMIMRHEGLVGAVGPMTPPSPGSVSTRTSICSRHSPEQRPLPDPMPTSSQHRLIRGPGRFPSFYEDSLSTELVLREKNNPQRQRAVSTMGPPSTIYGGDELQDTLRGSQVSDGTHQFIKSPSSPLLSERERAADHSTLALNHLSGEPVKLSAKYLHPVTYPDTSNWGGSRPTATSPFQLGCGGGDDNYYRLYVTASQRVTETFPGASTPRSMQPNSGLRPHQSVPRLTEQRIVSQSGRDKNIPEQQLTSTHLSYEGLVTG